MSPEQARGDQVDGRGDLFSLGVVIYQLCTGQLPFQGKSLTAVLTALALNQPPALRELNPNVPAALADLVMQLLEKDPARRPQSAAIVIDSLRAIERQLPGPASDLLERVATSDTAKTPTLGPAPAATPSPMPRGPAAPRSRRRPWQLAACITTCALLAGGLGWVGLASVADNENGSAVPTGPAPAPAAAPLRLGLLYSRTGTMAISERATLDGVLLAVAEINEKGGVLGRPLELVIEDGQSDETVFARKAAKLIEEDEVTALFGCWTSASRKAVKAVVEQHDHLLFYPVSYEGMEESPNIVYGGSVPNQQILPGLKWSYGFLTKRRWFLAGLDSVYSRATHAVIRDKAESLGANRGRAALARGRWRRGRTGPPIVKARPDLIVSTIKGDTNVALFRALHRAGDHGRAGSDPVLRGFGRRALQSASGRGPRPLRRRQLLPKHRLAAQQGIPPHVEKRFGSERTVSDPLQTSYTLVHLWAQAVTAAKSAKVGASAKGSRANDMTRPRAA